MLYTVASPDWVPGTPLAPSSARTGFFPTRAEARAFAGEGPTVAAAVRYDDRRRVVSAQGPVARAVAGTWTTPAIRNALGGISLFRPIPAVLLRVVPPTERRFQAASGRSIPRSHFDRRPSPPVGKRTPWP